MMAGRVLSPSTIRASVLVAHPDDEILWCGGWILLHLSWCWRVYTLCRASDRDRAPRFRRAMAYLGVPGDMADLDDGPDQRPLRNEEVERAILSLLGALPDTDILFTHGPRGEYTRHRRHEECHRAVVRLWRQGRIRTREVWCFAYQDGGGSHLPQVRADAEQRVSLPEAVWLKKRMIITDIYGFAGDSWEARAVPREEGFQRLHQMSA